MLVDDDPAVRGVLEALLEEQGLHVVGTADSSAGGLPLWATHRPDVAVLDLELGSASGADLAQQILRLDADAEVLLYTGCADAAKLRRAHDCGARGVVAKSASFDEVLGEIDTAAQASRLRRA
jgi:DNA-binding NarL/FixJ family response regulator